jgi:glycine cleavage system regulatory protein
VATFVLTVLGDDHPGIVSALSAPISTHGASWERSQLTRLAGKFAGIVLVSVPTDSYDPLVADLQALEADGLRLTIERTDVPVEPAQHRLHLELLGADHPGIVAEISAALAARGVSIEELHTDLRDAPMAGGTLFAAHAELVAPASATTEELRGLLEGLAHALMVDIDLSEDRPTG